jgi:predicted transcriptional regulator
MNTLLALLGNTTVSKIASRLGRTEKAIRRKAEKLGVSVAVVR